jgi:hypothetical protein
MQAVNAGGDSAHQTPLTMRIVTVGQDFAGVVPASPPGSASDALAVTLAPKAFRRSKGLGALHMFRAGVGETAPALDGCGGAGRQLAPPDRRPTTVVVAGLLCIIRLVGPVILAASVRHELASIEPARTGATTSCRVASCRYVRRIPWRR